MGGVSTPTSTQYTPHEDTSDEQGFSGDPHTPSHSGTGYMLDYPMSDLVSPWPNDLHSMSDHLGINEANAGTHERDLMLRSARPSAQGIPQAVAYTQTVRPNDEMTYPDDGTFQSWSTGYFVSGATPSVSVWEEREYIWTPDEVSTPVVPRYVPGSRTLPWSTYGMDDSQVENEPPPEQVLFALGSDGNASAPGFSAWSWRPNLTNQPTRAMSPRDAPQPELCSESDDSDDTIDRPPPDNPVGPPPKLATREAKSRNLNPDQRKKAALMRKMRSCWNCSFSKYSCDPGDICNKCLRMRKSPAIWECDRTYLPEWTGVFIPASLLSQHESDKLWTFCKERIRRWTDNCITVYLTWGYGEPIECKAYEIEPEGDDLLFQKQYRLNLTTARYDLCKVPSPPLGIKLIEIKFWRRWLNGYLNDLLQARFGGFPDTCFRGRECEVQRDLLHPMHAYYMEFKDAPLPRSCLKLIVMTHIMTHSLTLTEDTRLEVSSKLINPPRTPYELLTCPRWLNKELKFLMARLHANLMKEILELLHKNLRNGKDKKSLWATAFISLLSLSMVTESLQVSARCKEETDKEMNAIPQYDTRAELDLMDEKLHLLTRLFRRKYGLAEDEGGKGFNPLRDSDKRGSLDGPAQTLAVEVGRIIQLYRPFLQVQEALGGPPTTPNEPRTSRLVAKFLLSF